MRASTMQWEDWLNAVSRTPGFRLEMAPHAPHDPEPVIPPRRFMLINRLKNLTVPIGFIFLVTAGCNNGGNTDLNYKAAINDHFKAFPSCIWSQPKKFPVQAATSDDAKTEGYDALTQEGLLTRTTGEKKVLIIASKQVNNYDLSEKGRTSWTPDSSQPGYGNFCYGNRDVLNRQFDAWHKRKRCEDGRCQLPLSDCKCRRMGKFARNEDCLSWTRVSAWLERIR